MKNNIAAGLILLVLFTASTTFAETNPTAPIDMESPEAIKLRTGNGNPEAGKEKAQLCQGCHGEWGNSVDPVIPKLAGQYSFYISKQLRNYQTGERTHQIMNAMAATVSDEELADISAYFASQTKMSGRRVAENQLGKKLFIKGDISRSIIACVNCHGVNGKGRLPGTSMFPVIGGQHKDYLLGQLINFREANRTNSASGIMNITTKSLTDEEIKALAEYISEL
jgi:cytochrome c553